jgi:hypothetical protein
VRPCKYLQIAITFDDRRQGEIKNRSLHEDAAKKYIGRTSFTCSHAFLRQPPQLEIIGGAFPFIFQQIMIIDDLDLLFATKILLNHETHEIMPACSTKGCES